MGNCESFCMGSPPHDDESPKKGREKLASAQIGNIGKLTKDSDENGVSDQRNENQQNSDDIVVVFPHQSRRGYLRENFEVQNAIYIENESSINQYTIEESKDISASESQQVRANHRIERNASQENLNDVTLQYDSDQESNYTQTSIKNIQDLGDGRSINSSRIHRQYSQKKHNRNMTLSQSETSSNFNTSNRDAKRNKGRTGGLVSGNTSSYYENQSQTSVRKLGSDISASQTSLRKLESDISASQKSPSRYKRVKKLQSDMDQESNSSYNQSSTNVIMMHDYDSNADSQSQYSAMRSGGGGGGRLIVEDYSSDENYEIQGSPKDKKNESFTLSEKENEEDSDGEQEFKFRMQRKRTNTHKMKITELDEFNEEDDDATSTNEIIQKHESD